MEHRLTRIYTRTGDRGDTGLADGSRHPKDEPRLEAIGTVDELNSALGVLLAQRLPDDLERALTAVQHRLFDLGAELARPGAQLLDEGAVSTLERHIDAWNAHLAPLREFILPGGHPSAAQAHLARAVCRRAERRLVALHHVEPQNPHSLAYLNRLSDLLFVAARYLNHLHGQGDVLWQRGV